METPPIRNQQSIHDGKGTQVNDPQDPVVIGDGNTVIVNKGTAPQTRPALTGTPNNLPYSGATVFVGREQALEDLHEQLQQGQTVAISAISGMGGIGKTELAWQYADRHRETETYPGGICWLRAREEVGTQILGFARSHLDLDPPMEGELKSRVDWCWQRWRSGDALIVFDDVQTLDEIRSFLPPRESRFKVLMTSRSRFGSPVQNYEIQVLSEAASLNLLRAIVSDERIDQNLERAKQICEWLGYLPLGLELVGRYLARRKGTSIAKLWERLQAQKLAAKALLEAEPEMTASLGVTAAFELSWQELDLKAQQLAAFLSLFALAEIPWLLVQACLPEVDEEDLEDLREEQLIKLSLLNCDREGMFLLHQLLREFFAVKRSQMPEDEEWKRSFCNVMIAISRQIPQTVTLEIIERFTFTIPHIKEATTTLNPWLADHDVYVPSISLGNFYRDQSAFEEAEKWYLHSRIIVSQRQGHDHPAVGVSLNNLALLYKLQGRYEEAESLYLQDLEISQKWFGQDDQLVAISLNNLANLYISQQRYGEAEPLILQALDIMQQQFGQDDINIAIPLNGLAELYRLQGRYAEAEPLLLQALDTLQRHLGQNHPDVAKSMNNLGLLYATLGNYNDAGLLYTQALQIGLQTLGEDHPAVATWLHNLAQLCERLKRYAEAEPLYRQAIAICYERLGETHPNTQTFLNNFVSFLQQVIESDRTSELSDDPMTRSLLEQLQSNTQTPENDRT